MSVYFNKRITAKAKYARDSLSEGQERKEQQENKY